MRAQPLEAWASCDIRRLSESHPHLDFFLDKLMHIATTAQCMYTLKDQDTVRSSQVQYWTCEQVTRVKLSLIIVSQNER